MSTPETLTRALAALDAALRAAERAGFVSLETRERYKIGTSENPVFPGIFERAATAVGGSILAAPCAAEGRIA